MKPETNGTTGPPSVNHDGLGFPGESIALQHVYFFLSRSRIQEKDTKTNNQRKDK